MSLLDFLPAIGGAAGIAALLVAMRTAGAQGRKLDAEADAGEANADKTRAETRQIIDNAIAEETAAREARMKRLEVRIEVLEAENVDLRAQAGELRAQAAELHAQAGALQTQLATVTRDKAADEAEIARLRGELAHRDERIRDLEARIEVLEHAAENRRGTDAEGNG